MIFNHLHSHTQFSLLDGAADIKKMLKKAHADGMRAAAITDHGNMFGVFKFVAEAAKIGIKPIVGCEFYLVENRHKRSFVRGEKDVRYHQLMLAKNETGYKNLIKLCSLGFIEGMYGKYPRIDKELVLKYHEGLIATTCCLGAEVPRTILKKGEEEAEKVFKWWLDIFGEDYYIELQRHKIPDQEIVNQVLLKFAVKYNVKVIASNDSHYVERTDANAHDILLCINTGEKQSTPTMKDFGDDDEVSSKGKRFAFYNDEFFFKNTAEMTALFKDVPQAIDNTNEIVDKCVELKLKKDILLPNFPLPADFLNQDDYLRHLTMEGARNRYKELTPEVEERLNFELSVIRTMGFAGYFLIVQDYINAGRDLGVFVGPGRGSAAGSAVAYCIGITNIDPIKYDLLFERFLNPDRKSMPDIDTDFDDEGRQKVIDYVVDKYGKNQVAQIITYGTMAAKMSIKDVARVMDLPLAESNMLAKLVPDKPGTDLNRVLKAPLTGPDSLEEKEQLSADDLQNAKKLREILSQKGTLQSQVLEEALKLEGSVRNTGIHAAGIIIAPTDLTDLIPVSTAKDSDLLVTQFEGKIIEDAGVIKMDFLGLKNLTIIRDALKLIEQNHGKKIAIDEIPLTDLKTFELYQKGRTNGTFQFESTGMQKYLKELKPDKFEDLIAMNALYRPGPLAYIPNYINRKHGREAITYDLPAMEEYLKDTYGITVYQEQVMLLSQKLAGFTKGQADTLRKAMGKKDLKVLNGLKETFLNGAEERGHNRKTLEKIWSDWEAFASYAFNKSHSTCYAFVAFQTAYLKSHYPAEYLAAILTNNASNITKITFFMEECKAMGIPVLSPDVNESGVLFGVNKKGEIRFGMGAIKGVGSAVVEKIIEERNANGPFKSVFDLLKRMPPRTVNKKVLESLVIAGAMDCFGIERFRYFMQVSQKEEANVIEKALSWASKMQDGKNSAQASLFGGDNTEDIADPEPSFPLFNADHAWTQMETLNKEKEVIGFYLSGHPLDKFRWQLEAFPHIHKLGILNDAENDRKPIGTEIRIAGIVSGFQEKMTGSGKKFLTFNVEDFTGTMEMSVFSWGKEDAVTKFRPLVQNNSLVIITGVYQARYNDPTAFEFKIREVTPITEELIDGMMKQFTIILNNSELTKTTINSIDKYCKKNQGKLFLNFRIYDIESQNQLELASAFRVQIDNAFVENLKKLGIEYVIN